MKVVRVCVRARVTRPNPVRGGVTFTQPCFAGIVFSLRGKQTRGGPGLYSVARLQQISCGTHNASDTMTFAQSFK